MVKCKFCGSEIVCRFGHTKKGKQRFICNHCQRTFLNNNASEDMRYPVEVVSRALELFYESVPVREIRKQLEQIHGSEPSDVAIYQWVAKYTPKANKVLSQIPINTGPVWVAKEYTVKLKEKSAPRQWLWWVLDRTTKFFLAYHFSETRRAEDAKILMGKAVERARRIPQIVVTAHLLAYLDGVELAFGSDIRHVLTKERASWSSTIRLFAGAWKGKTKVIRMSYPKDTVRKFLEGWQVHYNFFRPNVSLGNRTPAEAAGADGAFKSWSDVVEALP